MRGIAGGPDVLGDHVGKPEEVVGNTRADSCPGRFVPPVLDIPLSELTASRQQDLRSRQIGIAIEKSHDVLQLIAKAECAAGLVKAGASPDAAAQALVLKPAVDQEVRGQFGGVHFNGAKLRIPPCPGLSQARSPAPDPPGRRAPVCGPAPPTRPGPACR